MHLDSLSWMPDTKRRQLQHLITTNSLHHCIVFSSIHKNNLLQLVSQLAQDWVEIGINSLTPQKPAGITLPHPDIIFLSSQGKSGLYMVEGVRSVIDSLSLRPFTGTKRAVIIEEADKMTRPAANALLKVLEEPTEGTIFLLTTCRLQKVLPTIISRSLLIHIPSILEEGQDLSQKKEMLDEIVYINAKKLFQNRHVVSTYDEIISFAYDVEIAYEKLKKEKEKMIYDEIENESATSLFFDEEQIQASVHSFANNAMCDLIVHLRALWKEKFVEMALIDRKTQRKKGLLPDEILYVFHDAIKAVELGINVKEILSQLLFTLFGYITPNKLTYDIC